MPSFQRGAVSPGHRRRTLRLRGAAFPLCRSIFMQGLHFKRRKYLQNYARHLFRFLISRRLRVPPVEFSAWLEIQLASQARQVNPALRSLFIFDTGTEKLEDLSTFVEDNWWLGTSVDPSRDPTAAVVEWFTSLHSLGFSLSGNFNVTDFAICQRALLRGERKLLKNLRKLTLKRRRRDMESCADMIEFAFYNNRGYDFIPVETKHLVCLLRHFEPRYSFLIRYHACHEDEERKMALLEIMHIRLRVLEKIDKPKYNRIIKKLRGYIVEWVDDNNDIGDFLTQVVEYQKQSKQRGNSDITVPEILVGLQQAMDDEGEFASLEWHRPSLGVQLIHED